MVKIHNFGADYNQQLRFKTKQHVHTPVAKPAEPAEEKQEEIKGADIPAVETSEGTSEEEAPKKAHRKKKAM